jgi:flagellar motor switch protein FliG
VAIKGHEKAAIFLSSVGEDVAAEIFKNLDPEDIGKVSSYMSRIKKADHGVKENVFKETLEKVTTGDVQVGGEDYVKSVLTKGLGGDDAERILEMVSKESPLESLKWVNAKTLSDFLGTEHPQTVALILCLLDPDQAAAVMINLPEQMRNDIAMRIASTDRIPESALEEIEEVLKVQLSINKGGEGKEFNGTKVIAEILNQCESGADQQILDQIEENNPEVAESIRELMLVFDDLEEIDDRGIQLILKELNTEELSLALKTASDVLKDKIFRNMSQRAAKILQEDMETKGPVKVSEVETAQKNIVRIARKLNDEGQIVIAGRGGEELVV